MEVVVVVAVEDIPLKNEAASPRQMGHVRLDCKDVSQISFLVKNKLEDSGHIPLATCRHTWNGIRGYREGFEVFVGPQNRTCRRRKWSDRSQNRHQYI